MAFPLTPEQEAKVRQRLGLQPDEDINLAFRALGDKTVKEIISSTELPVQKPPAAIAPAAPKKAVPAAQPVLSPTTPPAPIDAFVGPPMPQGLVTKTPQAKALEAGIPFVVQPETGMVPRTRGTSGRDVLGKAIAEKAVETAALGTAPLGTRITLEAEKALRDRAAALAEAGRTMTGERRTLTPTPQGLTERLSALPFVPEFATKTLEALMPQTIVTPAQAQDEQRKRDEAFRQALDYRTRNAQEFQGLTPEESKKRLENVVDFIYREGRPPESTSEKVLKAATTTVQPSGRVIESPLVTAGKILNIPEAALVTGAKAVAGKPAKETFYEEVKGGGGLPVAGAEAGRKTAESLGYSKDVQDIAAALGGIVGFGGSLLTPLDLGVVSAGVTGAKAATGSAKVAKALGGGTVDVAEAALMGGLSGTATGALDAWRIFGPAAGPSAAISKELDMAARKYMQSDNVANISEVTLELAANPKVQDAIRLDRSAGKATPNTYNSDNIEATLKAEYDALPESLRSGRTWEQYKSAAEGLGIDFTNTAGARAAAAEKAPANVVSKEAREALQRTSTGTRTTQYFDEIASGGRSDLYFAAAIDSLSDAAKADLIAGKAIKSVDLESAVDSFINKIRGSREGFIYKLNPEQLDTVASELSKALEKRGLRISKERILGTKAIKLAEGEAREAGSFILPKTPAGRDALKKSFIIDNARRTINNLSAETGITGRQVKIGDITLSPQDAQRVIRDVRTKAPVLERLKNKFKKSTTGNIEVSKEELDALQKYFIQPFQTKILTEDIVSEISQQVPKKSYVVEEAGRTAVTPMVISPTRAYSPFRVSPILSRVEKSAILSADQYNELVRSAIAIESSTKATAKSQQELAEIAGKLSAGDKRKELSYFVREVFKPKDFSESAITSTFVDLSRTFSEAKTSNPITKSIVDEINARMGSLADDFKRKMRAEMASKPFLDSLPVISDARPTAFSNVLVKEFTEGPVFRPVFRQTKKITRLTPSESPVPYIKRKDVVRRGGEEVAARAPRTAQEIADARKAGAYEMFRTVTASMFGGYEKTIDSISTTGRILDLDSQAISTAEMRNLISVMIETAPFQKYFAAFEEAVMSGNNIRAINILQRMHIDFFGYSLEQILTRKGLINSDQINNVLIEASTKASQRRGSDILGFNIKPNSRMRSPDESFRASSQQAMVVRPENFKELVTGSYFTKAQANILDDVLVKTQQKYPELYPSPAVLQDIAFRDYQTSKNALMAGLEKLIAEYEKASDIISASKIRDGLIPLINNAELSSDFRTYMQDLLIAGMEDYVASISTSSGATSKYFETISERILKSSAISKEDKSLFANAIKNIIKNDVEVGSVYKQIYGVNSRADATALFYQTALTDIRNQLKEPLSGSLQGVAEKTATIPLLTKEAAGLKRPIYNAVNLKSITETMEGITLSTAGNKLDQVVAKNGDAIAEQIDEVEKAVLGLIDGEISESEKILASLKESAVAGKGPAISPSIEVYRKSVISNIIDGLQGLRNLTGIAKNGMLGGLVLPNVSYLMANFLTAPAIMASTVGLGRTLKSLVSSPEAVDAMKWVYGPRWSKADKVLVTAPDGTIYTTSQIGNIISSGGIGKSQASAELTNQLINSAVDWAGRTGLYGDRFSAIKALKRNFVNWNDMNIWSTLANAVDQQFRTTVLISALKDGEQLPQAMKLARESLFDYGNLSDFEKSVISRVFWFWTFRRNNWRSVYTGMLMDPRRVKAAFAQQKGFSYFYDLSEKMYGTEDKDIDYRYPMKDYSENRMFLDLIEDPENKRRFAVFGPGVPQLGAVGDLIDYLSIPLGYAAATTGISGEPASLPQTAADLADLISQQSNPYVQALVAASIGIDLRTGRSLGTYLDPKLMWYIRKNETIQQTFDSFVQTEAVPFEEEKPGVGYYQGRQWRILQDDKQSQKNWSMFKSIMLNLGVKRTLEEYAPLAQSIFPSEGYQPEAAMQTDFWKAAGVTTTQDAPTIEEIQRLNRLEAAREIRAISPTEVPDRIAPRE